MCRKRLSFAGAGHRVSPSGAVLSASPPCTPLALTSTPAIDDEANPHTLTLQRHARGQRLGAYHGVRVICYVPTLLLQAGQSLLRIEVLLERLCRVRDTENPVVKARERRIET